jgi:hypothetical protein
VSASRIQLLIKRPVILMLVMVALLVLEACIIIAVMSARAQGERERLLAEVELQYRQRSYTIDGCEFVVDQQADTTVGKNQLVHADSCRNPVHWKHVLSDTSWYGKVKSK